MEKFMKTQKGFFSFSLIICKFKLTAFGQGNHDTQFTWDSNIYVKSSVYNNPFGVQSVLADCCGMKNRQPPQAPLHMSSPVERRVLIKLCRLAILALYLCQCGLNVICRRKKKKKQQNSSVQIQMRCIKLDKFKNLWIQVCF